MTPPNTINFSSTAPQAAAPVTIESPYNDSPDHLTFDEMREMPMHMALGFDTSIDD